MEKIGDWFLLHLITKNLDTLTVNEIVKQLHKEQEGNNSNTETLKLKPETSNVWSLQLEPRSIIILIAFKRHPMLKMKAIGVVEIVILRYS